MMLKMFTALVLISSVRAKTYLVETRGGHFHIVKTKPKTPDYTETNSEEKRIEEHGTDYSQSEESSSKCKNANNFLKGKREETGESCSNPLDCFYLGQAATSTSDRCTIYRCVDGHCVSYRKDEEDEKDDQSCRNPLDCFYLGKAATSEADRCTMYRCVDGHCVSYKKDGEDVSSKDGSELAKSGETEDDDQSCRNSSDCYTLVKGEGRISFKGMESTCEDGRCVRKEKEGKSGAEYGNDYSGC